MANIKKNFNFRNGVQVDDDNLLVTETGLVGIGTTVPTEALDVRGNVKIIGDATITNATVGILTLTEIVPTQIIGAGVSIKSGIVTAQGAGIVTFYGDARFLQGMPTSQWEDTNAGFGVSSIYNTGGTVGIATTNPQFALQVGENPNQIGGVSGRGVGISSVGNINASGIISATTFKGSLSGDVVGNVTGAATRVTLTNQVGDSSCNVLFAQSATGNQLPQTNPNFTFDATNATLTATNFVGNLTGNISGTAANLSGTPNLAIGIINASGISTFSNNVAFYPPTGGQVDFFGGGSSGIQRMRWRNNGSNSMLHFNDNVHAVFGSDQRTQFDPHGSGSAGHFRIEQYMDNGNNPFQIHSDFTNIVGSPTGGHEGRKIADFQYSDGSSLYHFGNKKLQTSGIGVTVTSQLDTTNIVASGVITATTGLISPLIGVGTDTPAHDIQVRKSGNVEIQVTSDTGSAALTVGREPSSGKTNNAEFRYGLVSGGAPYSSAQSLDIINFGTGNFNYHISANNPSGVDGDFHWHKGFNTRLMTLTGIGGSLGIGLTDPSQKLDVFGSAKISSSLDVGGNLAVTGTFTAGTLNATTINANLVGNATGNLTGLINSPNTGISTIPKLTSSGIGIGVTDQGFAVNINSNSNSKVIVTSDGRVGVGTTVFSATQVDVELRSDVYIHNSISVGSTGRSAVDFSDVVNVYDPTGGKAKVAYMIPPKVTTAQRDVFINGHSGAGSTVTGAFVYNTSTNTIQVYNGSSWGSLGSGGGGGEANQNAFSNVAVAGQSTVAADSTTDTLTLVAGSNVTLTTNAGNDSVTIAASGGGGGGISNVVEDTTPQLGGNLDVQAREINTSTSNGNIKLTPNGSGVVEVRGAGGNDGTLQLNCSAQSHGIKLKSPPHSASASYTLTFPNNIVNGQFLKTDASGNLSWDSRLGAGFVNAADYGLDASATDGTNVTAINNAIAALGTNGGTIFFPGGMFYLNAAISLGNSNNSIRFVGSGHQNYGGGSDAGGTVLRRDADDEFFNITNSRAIHFIGITFKGGAANGNGGNSGISGGNGAIYVLANAGCQGYLIENCVFHGIANCITFKGLSDSIIRGCRFRNVPSNEGAGACIKLDENGSEVIDQIRIQDCVIDGSPDGSALNSNIDGIAIYNTVSTVYVTNTSAIRLRRSFYSDSSWDGNFFYFQNSEAERASSDGFSINGTGNFVTIDNCFSSTNNGHGINIGSSQNSSLNITNPNVRDNSGHGILIDGPTNNCSIVNPAVGGNSRGSSGTNHGIVIGTNANNVYITGGKIGGNTDELAGTGTQGYGIQINGNTHSNIRIIGTNVTGNATNSSEGITLSISSGTGNSIQFNAGSTVAINT